MKERLLSGHLFAMICVLIWGTTFIVSKNLMKTLTPIQLMWMRFVIAYVALWALYPHWYLHWKEEPWFFLISLFGNTLYFLSENSALRLTQAANVSILVATAPIITALILRFTRGEKLTPRQGIGFAVSFVGVVLVVLNGVFMLRLHPTGDLLALAAAASWAVYSILIRRSTEEYNSFLITRKVMFYGILTSTPLLLLNKAAINFSALLTFKNIMGLVYLGFIGSALCYVMWNNSIRQLGTLKASIYINAIPLVTLLAGSVVLNETVTNMGAIGIILVIGGLLLSNLNNNHLKEKPIKD